MIQQTESKYKVIRSWGCLLMCYSWIVGKHFNHEFTMNEIEEVYDKALYNDIILTNAKPIDGSEGEWYRCWIKDPIKLMKLFTSSLGKTASPYLLYKDSTGKNKNANYKIVENISITNKKMGTHFTANVNGGEYNPDITIQIVAMKSVRGWAI